MAASFSSFIISRVVSGLPFFHVSPCRMLTLSVVIQRKGRPARGCLPGTLWQGIVDLERKASDSGQLSMCGGGEVVVSVVEGLGR